MPTIWKALAISICLTTLAATGRADLITDLKGDWSNTSNPNTGTFGTWTYREGTNALPFITDWTPLGASSPQPAWAPTTNGGDFLPAVFQATSNMFDWEAGDIIVHTRDLINGSGRSEVNLLWTSQFSGMVDLSGSAWIGRDIGRGNDITVLLNGNALTTIHVESGDPYSRTSPLGLEAGTGGVNALKSLLITPGDQIAIQLTKTSIAGDFVGINFAINSIVAVPEPSSALLVGISIAALVSGIRYRRNKI